MSHEDLHTLEQEIREAGQAARTTQRPLFVAGVLSRLYEHATSPIDRTALAYVVSLLLESPAQPGTQEKEDL